MLEEGIRETQQPAAAGRRWRAVRNWSARVSRWPGRSARINFRCRCGKNVWMFVRIRPGLYRPAPAAETVCGHCGRQYRWISQVLTRSAVPPVIGEGT
jgi:hypothetical protein